MHGKPLNFFIDFSTSQSLRQSSNFSFSQDVFGLNSFFTILKTCTALGHQIKMREEYFPLFLHNAHQLGSTHPLLIPFSQVNSLLSISSHKVIFLFRGALSFHKMLHHHFFSPKICASIQACYPNLVVNSTVLEFLDQWRTSSSSSSYKLIKFETKLPT
jgi:hypothetical protein